MITKILFFLFLLTFFTPKINFHGITFSDVILLVLLILSFNKKIKYNFFEKKYFKIIFYFITFYVIEEIIHFKINVDLAGMYIFVMDRISFIYFFILSYIILHYGHIIEKELIAKYLKVSIFINAIVLPYIFIFLNLGHYDKLTSLFVKPNQLAFFLISSPIILLLSNYLQFKNIQIKQVNTFILFLYLPIFASASKSGLMTLILIHIIVFFYSFKFFNTLVKFLYILMFIVLILVLNPYSFQHFIIELVNYFPQFNRVADFLLSDTIKSTDSFRDINNANGIKIFMQYPIFGIGFGTDKFLSPTGHEIHNTYIRILACLGIIGSLLFMIFNLYYIVLSKKVLKTNIYTLLFLVIFLFGWYHDIFTNRFYYFLFSLLLMNISFNLQKKIS